MLVCFCFHTSIYHDKHLCSKSDFNPYYPSYHCNIFWCFKYYFSLIWSLLHFIYIIYKTLDFLIVIGGINVNLVGIFVMSPYKLKIKFCAFNKLTGKQMCIINCYELISVCHWYQYKSFLYIWAIIHHNLF